MMTVGAGGFADEVVRCDKREVFVCCIILRDQNEEVQERMRERLGKEENRARYNLRGHAAESPFGNAKRNRKFTFVMRRGREKVMMEMALLFMLHNMMKISAQMRR